MPALKINWTKNPSRFLNASLIAGMLVLSGCSGGDINVTGGASSPLNTYFVLGNVEDGQCTLNDASGKKIAGPVATVAGKTRFEAVPNVSGLGQIVCEGGTYADEATGKKLTAPKLRALVSLDGKAVNVIVTPLTEIAVKLLGTGKTAADYQQVLANLASTFGLKGIDLSTEIPTVVGNKPAGGDAASRYGLVLASLSQLQVRATLGDSADAVITKLAAGFDSKGNLKDANVRNQFSLAVQDMVKNPLLKDALGGANNDTVRTLFEEASHSDVLASVDAIDTDNSLTQSGEDSTIDANVTSTITLYGQDMYLGLQVTLGGKKCLLRDLQPMESTAEHSDEEQMLAQCPAQPLGKTKLVVKDKTEQIAEFDLEVTTPEKKLAMRNKAQPTRFSERIKGVASAGTGPASIAGMVTAVAPTINSASGSLNYQTLRTFLVKGVVVELLDRSASDTVLATTSTDNFGKYSFTGIDEDKNVVVRVKAQLLQTRAAGVTTGAQWSFAVRDNTSTASPKTIYSIDAEPVSTTSEESVVNLVAPLGFDATGVLSPSSGDQRKSGPFSILEVVYNAATKIQVTDANLSLPELNIYWSANNVGAPGDREKGQIDTSHYSGAGALPGVFILGKADVDTDEFDQGVIGHEFGHYLQAMLSYSDSPGGAHSGTDYKDASLSYGEGYGTAVGGLIIGSPFYTDSSGPRQAGGAVTNLSVPTDPASASRGFYSEISVGYVMYNIGIRYGFSAFWKAVSAMRNNHHSATIFAFLNVYLTANPSAAISDLLVTENIRSTNGFGVLQAGSVPDALINSAASGGATDLESLYVNLVLSASQEQATPENLTPNAPTFCVNRNLPGANTANGLGMARRHTFTATYSGTLGIKPQDDRGVDFDPQSTYVTARDSLGNDVSMFGWDNGLGFINIVQGRTYTVTVRLNNPAGIFNGNRCANRLNLWRFSA